MTSKALTTWCFALALAAAFIAREAHAQQVAPPVDATAPPAEGLTQADMEKIHWLRGFKFHGYAQPQLVFEWYNAAGSPNAGATGLPPGIGSNDVTAKPDGTTTNPDFFRIRRARLKAEFMPSESARFVFEIEPILLGAKDAGTGTIARQVEAQGIVRWTPDIVTEFALGEFKIPFGYEVLQGDIDRPFIERSWGERNLTPGEYDIGARAYTTAFDKRLTFQTAIVNGNILSERTFALMPDLNKGKDLLGRVNYNFGPFDVGMTGYVGTGQIVDPVALRFKQYGRWAVNFEVGVHHAFFPIGQTRVFAEATRAQNMDRGTKYAFALPSFPADVVHGSVNDLDEMSYWVRVEQDVTKWLTFAARYDFYTPDSAQGTNGRDQFGAVGIVHFTKGLQMMLEYDHATDNVHKPGTPAPSKQINTASTVLQVRF